MMTKYPDFDLETSTPNLPGYKRLLKERIRALKRQHGQRFTNERVARDLRIEPPYLSRCLNHPDHHPSRELLYRICAKIDLTAAETETILTHYDYTQAATEAYRRHLAEKLQMHQIEKSLEASQSLRQWVQSTADILNQLRQSLDSIESRPPGAPPRAS